MNNIPSFRENDISVKPALNLFKNFGYKYLTHDEAFAERSSKNSNVLLEKILDTQLRKINHSYR